MLRASGFYHVLHGLLEGSFVKGSTGATIRSPQGFYRGYNKVPLKGLQQGYHEVPFKGSTTVPLCKGY